MFQSLLLRLPLSYPGPWRYERELVEDFLLVEKDLVKDHIGKLDIHKLMITDRHTYVW